MQARMQWRLPRPLRLNIWLLLGAVVGVKPLAAAALAVDFVLLLGLLLRQAFRIP